jgi:hypothetical protein
MDVREMSREPTLGGERWGSVGRLRGLLRMRRVQVMLVIAGVVLAAGVFLPRLPRLFEATGTLDECYWGWPIVVFDGPDPEGLYPVEAWPPGLRYDSQAHVLVDADGHVLLRKGDRVRVRGAVIEAPRDIPPCFEGTGIRVDQVSAP